MPAVFVKTLTTPVAVSNEMPEFGVFIVIRVVPVPPDVVIVSVIEMPTFVLTFAARADANAGPFEVVKIVEVH